MTASKGHDQTLMELLPACKPDPKNVSFIDSVLKVVGLALFFLEHEDLTWRDTAVGLATPLKSHQELLLLPLFLRAVLCLPLSLILGKFPQGKWSRSLVKENHSFCLFACMLSSALVAVGTRDSTGLWHPF